MYIKIRKDMQKDLEKLHFTENSLEKQHTIDDKNIKDTILRTSNYKCSSIEDREDIENRNMKSISNIDCIRLQDINYAGTYSNVSSNKMDDWHFRKEKKMSLVENSMEQMKNMESKFVDYGMHESNDTSISNKISKEGGVGVSYNCFADEVRVNKRVVNDTIECEYITMITSHQSGNFEHNVIYDNNNKDTCLSMIKTNDITRGSNGCKEYKKINNVISKSNSKIEDSKK